MESSNEESRNIEKIKVISGSVGLITIGDIDFKISIDDLAVHKYKKGQILNKADWQKLLTMSVAFLAKAYSFKLLGYGAKSEKEINKKIYQKIKYWLYQNKIDLDKQIIGKIVSDSLSFLKQKNFINDSDYVDALIRKYDDKSKKEIFFKLISKGIDKNIINEKLANFDDNEKKAIRIVISRKIRNKNNFDDGQKRKLLSYLFRKGFSIGLAKTEIDDLLKTK